MDGLTMFLESTSDELWKIADFPENDLSMENCIPEVLQEVHRAIPFPRHIRPDGGLNLVSSLPWLHLPDVKAKFFAGEGSTNHLAATNLHTDLANAANICVYAAHCPESEQEQKLEYLRSYFPTLEEDTLKRQKIAALWFVFWPQDYDGLKAYLLSKGKKVDPIQRRTYQLTPEDIRALSSDKVM